MAVKRGAENAIRRTLSILRVAQSIVLFPLANVVLRTAKRKIRLGGGVTRRAIVANGVPCEWIIPRETTMKGVLLYIHGGGFVLEMSPFHLTMAARLAGMTGFRVLLIQYRLAPKYPFPAALDDCVAVYTWLLGRGKYEKDVVFAGDSAGGNLVIASLLRLKENRIPLPRAGVCLSPVVNLKPGANIVAGFKDPLLPAKAMRLYRASYVGRHDPSTPLISPLLGELSGLPPLLLHVGEDEVLRDNAVRFAELAKEAGVDAACKVYPRMWHVWQLYEELPQTAQSLEEIAVFIASHLTGV